LQDIKYRYISLAVITNRVSFLEYLQGFYVPSFYIQLHKQNTAYQKSISFIDNQHNNKDISSLYKAIFLASSLSTNQRNIFNLYGISHLVAISGFHISIIIGVLFIIFNPLYKIIQRKYFPYRNRWLDLSIFSFVIVFAYLIFIGSPPSLLRSVFMYFLLIVLAFSYLEILSFSTLSIVYLSLIAIDIRLLFSLGLFFSISGVFYIYLFLKYYKNMNKVLIVLFLNVYLFISIAPIIHYFFPISSPYQTLSIPLSIVFSLFYPISFLLHLINEGNLLDGFLLKAINLDIPFIEVKTPLYLYISYIISSLIATKYKLFFIFSLIIASLFWIYLMSEFYFRQV